MDANGRAVPSKDLSAGRWFWRLASGAPARDAAVWGFTVRAGRGHAAPSLRGIDVDGDDFADLVLGGGLLRGTAAPLRAFAPIAITACDKTVPPLFLPACHAPHAIAPWGDFDGDGFGDARGVGLLLRGGAEGLAPSATLPCAGDDPCMGRPVGDVNGDGYQDVLFSESIRLGSTRGFEGRMGSPLLTHVRKSVPVGDVDADGFEDLVTLDASARTVTLVRGGARELAAGGKISIEPKGRPGAADPSEGGVQVDIAIGDFNGDGAIDVATVAVTSEPRTRHVVVTVHARNASADLGQAVVRRVTWAEASLNRPSFLSLESADVDGDGVDEVVLGLESLGSDLRVIRVGPNALIVDPWREPGTPSEGMVSDLVSVGDVDGNGCDDVLLLGSTFADPHLTVGRLYLGGKQGFAKSLKLSQAGVDRVPEWGPPR